MEALWNLFAMGVDLAMLYSPWGGPDVQLETPELETGATHITEVWSGDQSVMCPALKLESCKLAGKVI